MKSVAAIVAFGLIAAVHAQDQCAAVAAKIPSCATQCIAKAAGSVGCTNPTDFACQCKNTAAINGAALNCVLSGCGAETGIAVQASASAVCACVSSAGSSQPTDTPSKPAETAAVPTAHGPQVVASSSAPAAGSSAPASTSARYPTAAASQISDGQVQAGTATPSATGAKTGNSTVMSFTGAGVKTVASVGGVLAAFMAAIVAL